RRPSRAVGARLPGATPVLNVAAMLVEMARRQPDAGALIDGARRLTFRGLDAESDRLARGLAQLGVRRGTRATLMVPPSLEFYALTFALFKLGAAVVLIDPGMGLRNLGTCLAEAEPEAFVGVPKAHLACMVLRWAKKTLRIRVTVGGWAVGPMASLDHV